MMANVAAGDLALSTLAEQVGLAEHWTDVHGRAHCVSPDVLRFLLGAMDLPCSSLAQIRSSQHRISQRYAGDSCAIITDVGVSPVFNHRGSLNYLLTLENGKQTGGVATQVRPSSVRITPVASPGYHTLAIGDVQLPLVVAPPRCPSVSDLAGVTTRIWGVSAQLYSLLSADRHSFGMAHCATRAEHCSHTGVAGAGDYCALAQLVREVARQGASAVAISPVHAMFSAVPDRYSPYAPSSRLFLNAAYINATIVFGVEAVRRAAVDLEDSELLTRCDDSIIDWPRVLQARMRLFARLFVQFNSVPPPHLKQAFQDFRCSGGEALERHCCYEALNAHFVPLLGAASGWREWPIDLRDPDSAAVRAYAESHVEEISFHAFLQWLADEGMRYAQKAASQAGMAVGLITDLAIGTDGRGSDAWSQQGDILDKVSVGAAPDLYHPQGQNWGLTAFSPEALRARGFIPFIQTLRASLAHAGGVRIDHILGLARLWLIPRGLRASDGAYLRYPLDDLLRLLALEASRHKAIVIGENLGTVPPGFDEHLCKKGIFGISVLWFERKILAAAGHGIVALKEGAEPRAPCVGDRIPAFIPPDKWPLSAIATSTTHDLPTIAGWWSGGDLRWRRRLDQITDDELIALSETRQRDKEALWRALRNSGCIPADLSELPTRPPREAILSFVARVKTPLCLIPIEDLLGTVDQPNLPGADGVGPLSHPNWRQRLPKASEILFGDASVRQCVDSVVRARGVL